MRLELTLRTSLDRAARSFVYGCLLAGGLILVALA